MIRTEIIHSVKKRKERIEEISQSRTRKKWKLKRNKKIRRLTKQV